MTVDIISRPNAPLPPAPGLRGSGSFEQNSANSNIPHNAYISNSDSTNSNTSGGIVSFQLVMFEYIINPLVTALADAEMIENRDISLDNQNIRRELKEVKASEVILTLIMIVAAISIMFAFAVTAMHANKKKYSDENGVMQFIDRHSRTSCAKRNSRGSLLNAPMREILKNGQFNDLQKRLASKYLKKKAEDRGLQVLKESGEYLDDTVLQYTFNDPDREMDFLQFLDRDRKKYGEVNKFNTDLQYGGHSKWLVINNKNAALWFDENKKPTPPKLGSRLLLINQAEVVSNPAYGVVKFMYVSDFKAFKDIHSNGKTTRRSVVGDDVSEDSDDDDSKQGDSHLNNVDEEQEKGSHPHKKVPPPRETYVPGELSIGESQMQIVDNQDIKLNVSDPNAAAAAEGAPASGKTE